MDFVWRTFFFAQLIEGDTIIWSKRVQGCKLILFSTLQNTYIPNRLILVVWIDNSFVTQYKKDSIA